jgi:hypothetical protein
LDEVLQDIGVIAGVEGVTVTEHECILLGDSTQHYLTGHAFYTKAVEMGLRRRYGRPSCKLAARQMQKPRGFHIGDGQFQREPSNPVSVQMLRRLATQT